MQSRLPFISNLIAGTLAIYEVIQISGLFSYAGIFVPLQIHLSISLLGVITLIYLAAPKLSLTNVVLLLMAFIPLGFIMFDHQRILNYGDYGYLDLTGQIMTLLLAITLLEATRRRMGSFLPILIVFMLFMNYFQNYLPGKLRGAGTPLDALSYNMFVGTSGIFGIPFNVAVNILLAFLIFGALLQASGAGKWIIDIAIAMTGRTVGGPAKASVVASAMMGSISGSVGGNVASTGNFTIPLMKKVGYPAAFAGAVEAAASTGGVILPPVMGAVAFVMAEFLGVRYAEIVKAAILPAVLYFAVIFAAVHFRAKKLRLPTISKEDQRSVLSTFTKGWFYLIPVVALLYFLFVKRSDAEIAAMASFPFIIAVSFLSRDRGFWLTPKRIWDAMVGGIKDWLSIAAITAAVGMFVGTLMLSGLGNLFAGFIVNLGGGHLLLTLILVGVACLILGMGLDAIPAYLTLVVLTAPALVELGLSGIQSHFYILYWGLASFITPPVCIAVYVAIGISGSKLGETAIEALKIGMAVYLVPLAFALNPAILMQGTLADIIFSTVTALIGAVVLAAAIQGYSTHEMNPTQRILFAVSSLLFLFDSGLLMTCASLVIVVITLLWQRGQHSNSRNNDLPA